ncbi:MAG TPA: SAM-dependent methyltransferase [Pyrinomonadaceae bacterium]|nr:SAM-dependent methyltransferase [Pyrinomonadaceae bacterium]
MTTTKTQKASRARRKPSGQAASANEKTAEPSGNGTAPLFNERLVIIGTGIRTVGQLTMETVAWIERADKLFYVIADPIAEEVILRLNPKAAENLVGLYGEGKPRMETYNQMVDTILASVRAGNMTVGAFYGHPGVFAYPSHESVRRARAEGYVARMLPGVSAEDCLFADLGVDPAQNGCQSYEATDFLVNGRVIDNSSQVILWQIGVLGDWTFKRYAYDLSAMPLLLERLSEYYPLTHEVYIYEAATLPGCEAIIKKVPIHMIPYAGVTAASTLYIPPARQSTPDPRFYTRMRLPQQQA